MKKIFYAAIILLIAACSKEDTKVTPDQAERILNGIPVKILKGAANDILYAYSDFELQLEDNYSKTATQDGISSRCEVDSVSASVGGQRVKLKYKQEGTKITVSPDPCYTKSGKLDVILHSSRYFSTILDGSPTPDSWQLLKSIRETAQLEVVGQILPYPAIKATAAAGRIETSVYHIPHLSLNYAPGQTIGNAYKYEPEFSLKSGSSSVALTLQVVGDSSAYFTYDGQLAAQKDYLFTATAKWFRKTGNTWTACDPAFDQTVTQQFATTGNPPAGVLASADIEFSYPLNRQFNFLRKEHDKGYFRMKDWARMKQYTTIPLLVRIEDVKSNMAAQEEIIYNKQLNVFEYVMPQNFLENEKVYKVNVLKQSDETPVYSYYFKTSKFDRFSEKWNVIKTYFYTKWNDGQSGYLGKDYYINEQKINLKITGETLDYYECDCDPNRAEYLSADPYKATRLALIQFETHVEESWKNTADWLIYDQPSLSIPRRGMLSKKYGFPPVHAIYFLNKDILLSDKSLSGDIEYVDYTGFGIFAWTVQSFTRFDKQCASSAAHTIPEENRTPWQQNAAREYKDLPRLNLDFALGGDTYPLLDMFYVLPGINIKTTTIKDIQL